MATRIVEGKKPYTGGKAISIDENKVISLNLRDENNLIIYDEGDDEIYVDLQLDDEITPTSAFPIGVNVGRVIVDNGWDKPGTIISAETTSGDNIKIFYADEGTLWIDNGTGTFKQIYFKADVDALLLALRNYIDGELAKKQNGVSSDTAPSNPSEGDLWYDTTNSAMKVWDGTAWQSVGTGGGGSDIEYVTQAEYNALLPGALTDNKHYFIYSTDGGGGWQPGANTIAYYPLTDDFNDHKGSGTLYDLTENSASLTTLSGVKCADLNSSYCSANFNLTSLPYTISFYVKPKSTSNTIAIGFKEGDAWGGSGIYVFSNKFYLRYGNPTDQASETSYTMNTNRNHIVVTMGTDGSKIYVNGNLFASPKNSLSNPSNNSAPFYIGHDSGNSAYGNSYVGSVILENKVRTAQEIADYYNQTKGDYGIS